MNLTHIIRNTLIIIISISVCSCVKRTPMHAMSPVNSTLKVAQLAEKAGHVNIAEHAYQTAYKRNHKDITPLIYLAKLYEKTDQIDKAIKLYEKIHIIDLRFSAHKNLAILFTQQGDFEKSISEWNQAVKDNQKPAAVYNDIGVMLSYYKFYHLANVCYEKAIILNNKNTSFNNNLAISQILANTPNATKNYLANKHFTHSKNPMIIGNYQTIVRSTNTNKFKLVTTHSHAAAELNYKLTLLPPHYATQLLDICTHGHSA